MIRETFRDARQNNSLRRTAGYTLAALSLAAAGASTAQAKIKPSERQLDARIQLALNRDAKIITGAKAMKDFGGRSAVSEVINGSNITFNDAVDVKYGYVDMSITAPKSKDNNPFFNDVSKVNFSENLIQPDLSALPVVDLVATKDDEGGWTLKVRDEDALTGEVSYRKDAVSPTGHERRATSVGVKNYLGQMSLIISNAEIGVVAPHVFPIPVGF